MTDFINILKRSLHEPLPGLQGQLRMAPDIRKVSKNPVRDKDAAVLLLLIQELNDYSIVFIQRTFYDGPHGGQVSFPGGRKERQDKNLLATALRESKEEIGVCGNDIEILGKLSRLRIPISNYNVQPFVGVITYKPKFKIDSKEVDHIIQIPLVHFLDKKNIKSARAYYQEISYKYPYYLYKNYRIWGATAMILSEFISIIEKPGQNHSQPEG